MSRRPKRSCLDSELLTSTPDELRKLSASRGHDIIVKLSSENEHTNTRTATQEMSLGSVYSLTVTLKQTGATDMCLLPPSLHARLPS